VLSRSLFLSGTFALGTGIAAAPLGTDATGAKPGPYCLPLRKGVADKNYDFELEILDDPNIFSLADNLGHPVWLNFFATWCPPCNKEMPDVVRIAAKYAASGLRVFGVDVREPNDKVHAFAQKYAIPFPILLDREGSVFKAFGFQGYPTHMFFGANGALTCVATEGLEPNQMDNEVAVAIGRAPLATSSPSATP
jgi:thiol-disulfide isomerase/thioredoxin